QLDLVGKVGIASITAGDLVIRTNAEIIPINGVGEFEIVRHVHTYQDGEEVAKGRRGGEGFVIKFSINLKEQ
ncbi:hypothetical protein CEW46_31005, partial [Bacillus cereus]